jgi:hypothetical protein
VRKTAQNKRDWSSWFLVRSAKFTRFGWLNGVFGEVDCGNQNAPVSGTSPLTPHIVHPVAKAKRVTSTGDYSLAIDSTSQVTRQIRRWIVSAATFPRKSPGSQARRSPRWAY